MSALSTEKSAFDRSIRPVMEVVLPECAQAVVDFRPDPQLQERIEELAGKANEGELTTEEQAEYEGYIRANAFIAVLQKQARKVLEKQSG